jgi:hypothetical protein
MPLDGRGDPLLALCYIRPLHDDNSPLHESQHWTIQQEQSEENGFVATLLAWI